MDMSGLVDKSLLALCIPFMSTVLGFLAGYRVRSPRWAFLCGAATAVFAAGVIASTVVRPGWQDLLLACLPSGLVAGWASSAFRARPNRRLSPLERQTPRPSIF